MVNTGESMDSEEIKQYTDEEKVQILTNFATNLLANQKPLEPEFAKILQENFWELLS